MWPKYHYAALLQMAHKFKTKFTPLSTRDEYFESLPFTHFTSQNLVMDFEDYVRSDLLMEIIRQLKIRIIAEQNREREYDEEIVVWGIDNIVDPEEEEIFIPIFQSLQEEGRLWGPAEDKAYEQRSL